MSIWKCKDKEFDLRVPTLMGILNITPDSFSDGGKFNSFEAAMNHAHMLLEQGAHIIDVGGESTRPGSDEVSAQEELERVLLVVKALVSEGVCVSIDTRHASVAKACIDAGAQIINDISGFENADMREVVAKSDVGIVLMHMQGEPKHMQNSPEYVDVVKDVRKYLLQQAAQLESLGVEKERICLDFGIGFGKSAQHNKALLAHTQDFAKLGYPLMLAVSRKSYIGIAAGLQDVPAHERDEASALCAAAAFDCGAQVFRVHNVEQTRDAIENAKRVIVALGSNMGNRVEHLLGAAAELCKAQHIWLSRMSSIYESEPAYKQDQAPFANACAICYTTLSPYEFLDALHKIENEHGRVREEENGPRTLDLDIVDFEGFTCNDDILTLPHPRALERDFVVTPIKELSPNYVFSDFSKLNCANVEYGHISSVLKKCI